MTAQLHYLKFSNKAEGVAALCSVYGAEDGAPIMASHTHTLFDVGLVEKPGCPIDSPEFFTGYHYNLSVFDAVPAALLPYIVTPTNPSSVLA